jgi:hypothetical protein
VENRKVDSVAEVVTCEKYRDVHINRRVKTDGRGRHEIMKLQNEELGSPPASRTPVPRYPNVPYSSLRTLDISYRRGTVYFLFWYLFNVSFTYLKTPVARAL